MSRSPHDDETRLIRYLLGLLPEGEAEALEEEYLLDDERHAELQAAERELIDRYVAGDLSAAERARFETFFLASPGRADKVRFASALKTYGATRSVRSFPARAYTAIAASVIVALVLGVLAWRIFSRSAEQEVLLALGRAYRTGRLLESRISGLEYVPLAQSRGVGAEEVDAVNLSLAESIALKEAANDPGGGSFHTLGRVYLAQRNFARAVELLRNAAAASPQDARIQSDLAVALMEQARQTSDPERRARETVESLERFNRALELDPSQPEARFNRALLYESMHLPERAEAEWERYLRQDPRSRWAAEARAHLERLRAKKGRARTNGGKDFEQFLAAAARGDDAEAWKLLRRNRDRISNTITKRLLDESLRAGDPAAARARLELVSLAGRLEIEHAGDRFTADLADRYRTAGPSQLKLLAEGRALLESALAAYRKSEYEQATSVCREAERLFTLAGNECEAAVARFWAGACALRAPDTERALAIFEPLADLGSRRGYRLLLAQSLTGIADAQASMRELSKSLDTMQKALEIYESIQDARGLLWTLQASVFLSQQFGDFHRSNGFAMRALDLAASLAPEPREIWPFHQQIASNLQALGRPAAALDHQQAALALAIESGAPLLKSRSYALLALIHQKLRDYPRALESGRRALAEARAIEGRQGRNNLIANATLNLAHVHREMGQFGPALSHYDRAIELHRQMNLHIYVAEAHRGKLQSLIALGDRRGAAEEIGTAIELLEQDRPRIVEDGNRNSYFDLAQSTYDLAIDFAWSELNDPRAAFRYSEASHGRSLLDLLAAGGEVVRGREGPDVRVRTSTRPLELAEIQRLLPPRSRILQYAVLDAKVIAWVISPESVASAHRAVSLDELTRQVTAFVESISGTSPPARTASLGKALYETLIGPVAGSLDPAGTVFIVPDKILHDLPFAALIDPAGRHFIERHAFKLAPSATLAVSRSGPERPHSGGALVIGNPSFDAARFPSLPDLPAAAREAEAVARLYEPSLTLTGPEARAGRVKALLPAAEVVHFAGHYVPDERSPMLSKLVLSGGDALTAAEIYGMKLRRTRLVVLSACRTGVDRHYRGEGAVGIARPFLQAGAPAVVASLWPVRSEQAARLMIAFHRRRQTDGLPAARALRQAQLDLLNSHDPADRDPHAWAAFVAIGGSAEL